MMTCIDCGDPSGELRRCAECLEEVRETPNWREAVRPPAKGTDLLPYWVSPEIRRLERIVAAVGRLRSAPTRTPISLPPLRRCRGCDTGLPIRYGRGRRREYCATTCRPSRARLSAEGRHCEACAAPILGQRLRFCSRACSQWAKRHPDESRTGQTCRGCGEQFQPSGTDKWCPTCRSSTPPCEQCRVPMPWRLAGRQPARFCTLTCAGAYQAARAARLRPTLCTEPGCSNSPKGRSKICGYHERLRWPGDAAKAKARQRIKTHRRKDWARLTDITPEYEMALRVKAKRCPMCQAKLIDQPYMPTSKELDHIIPKGVGGTHTIGNVRIICRSCNVRRPKDGSDYVGQVTLWAEAA